MAIAKNVKTALASSSMIRKMFEEGAALKKLHGADGVFDFSLGNPDVEPPAAFHRTLLELATEDARGSHGYMPNAGYADVREAVAAKAAREQCAPVSGSHIVMSVGAAGGLNSALKAVLDPGDEVIVCKPYFMEYRSYVANHGGKVVEVDALEDFDLNVAGIKAALGERSAAVLINSPNNPTGRVYGAQTLEALAGVLAEHGRKSGRWPYLIADEPYREIVFGGKLVPPVLSVYKNSIVVTSYSKCLSLAGERIGYIAVSPDADEPLELLNALIYATRVLGYVNAPALMQRCVARLTDVSVDASVYERRRDAFKEALDGAGIAYAEPEGAFYVFARVPHKGAGDGDDLAFSEHLKKHLILGVPGSGFGKKGWMRFAYCVREELIRASAGAFKKAVAGWV
ncbi:MAG: pyridoxal phosphate-dependent aminotransferase [Spirochaetaceae bacterium]|jgi:aspartate aminotransferase|nr:pyridoxal phosphate-dependent aminotransferase [Spirochaetaceae bacterium]